jgi:hypothetical protein
MTQSLLRFIQLVRQEAISQEQRAMTEQLGLPLAQVVYKVEACKFTDNRYFSGSPCKLKAAQKNGASESARSHISTCARRNAAPTGSFCSSKFR